MKQLEMNITKIIYKLEMIFLPLFFNSIEHLLIYLTYKAKFKGLAQDEWMYTVKRLGITCILSAYYGF
jgi:hypothetical protein